MLIQAQAPLKAIRGGTFDTQLSFTSNGSPLVLTSYSAFSLVVDDLVTLTSGHGLTVNGAQGTILAVIDATTTASVTREVSRWYLQWTDPSGNVQFPVGGQMTFGSP